MPNPHFDVQIISRGNGKSAVASAAYRSGSKITRRQGGSSALAAASYRSGEALYDERARKTYDYTRKEDVILTEIMLPEGAPGWLIGITREQLWNKVEGCEKRKDAQLARDIIASLPRELNREQQIALTRAFVKEHFTDKGMIADIAIHDKQASDGYAQPHLHIMLTMRDITAEGFGQKNRQWNDRRRVTAWRDSWETRTNEALEKAGRPEQVSLKSNRERGIDKVPQEYMGYEAWALEQKGIETAKGERNRKARHENQVRDGIAEWKPAKRKEKAKGGTEPVRQAPGRTRQAAERRHLGEIARNSKPDSGEAQRRASDEQDAYRRFARIVLTAFQVGSRMLDPSTMEAMMVSRRHLLERRRMEAAISRYSLLHSSRELAEELNRGKENDRGR